VLANIDKNELAILKRAKLLQRVIKLPMMWALLILYSFAMVGVILWGIFRAPDSFIGKMVNQHVGLSIFLLFAMAIVVMFIPIRILNKADAMEKRFCDYLASREDITSDDVVELGEKYNIKQYIYVALQKRLKELNITKVPDCCTDGRELLRLPTKEDLLNL